MEVHPRNKKRQSRERRKTPDVMAQCQMAAKKWLLIIHEAKRQQPESRNIPAHYAPKNTMKLPAASPLG